MKNSLKPDSWVKNGSVYAQKSYHTSNHSGAAHAELIMKGI